MAHREATTQSILLARSFEEADRAGILLTASERRHATERARAAGGSLEAQAEVRATVLLAALEARVRGLASARAATRLPGRLLLLLPAIGFLIGLATNALGPERRVNILALPLLGLLGWNVAVYAALVIEVLARRRHRSSPDARSPGGRARAFGRFLGGLASGAGRVAGARDPGHVDIVRRALAGYAREWARASAPRAAALLRAALHLGAAAMAMGVVVGMYARGLTFEYRATWESTFLGAAQVEALLRGVLGPAAALLGVQLPDAATLEAMRAPAGSADAALWVHLWAVTAALVVVVPRLVLAGLAWRRARADSLSIDPVAGAFRVLLDDERGFGRTIEVVPYSLALDARSTDGLRELLHDVFGARAQIALRPTVAYGEDLADRPADAASPDCSVIVFPLVQPPESEVHGRAVRELAHRQAGKAHPASSVVAIVDGSGWRERLGEIEPRRLGERRRAWDRVLAECDIAPLHLDLVAPIPEDAAEAVESRLPAAARDRMPGPTRASA